MIIFADQESPLMHQVVIKVVGVGGAGGNAVSALMKQATLAHLHTIVMNTDAQALSMIDPMQRLQIGKKTTKGLGTGDNPEIGRQSAEEDLELIVDTIGTADVVFLIGGMGGGTGSGALPLIAQALRERNILTIAIVTKPFTFEGKRRARVAQETIALLSHLVDTLIVVPNETLLNITAEQVSMLDGFALINNLLAQTITGIVDIITKPGHINVDFADVCTIMKGRGLALMGTGKAVGPQRAQEAARLAISSPLLEHKTIAGAKGILLNICGGKNLGLHEMHHAAAVVYELADDDAHIIIGSVIDEQYTDEVMVTIIATGFDQQEAGALFVATPAKEEKMMHVKATVRDYSVDNTNKESQEMNHLAVVQKMKQKYMTTTDTQEAKEVMSEDSMNEEKKADLADLDIPTFLRNQESQ